MKELIELLQSIKNKDSQTDEKLMDQAIQLANDLSKQQQEQTEEVERLSQIIRDVRTRDAQKKCLCRGIK